MTRPCSLCLDPRRAEIDSALVAHDPLERTAKKFGVPATNLRRHRNHVLEFMGKSGEAPDADRLWMELDSHAKQFERLQKRAEADGNWPAAISARDKRLSITKLKAEITGALRDRAPQQINLTQVNIDVVN